MKNPGRTCTVCTCQGKPDVVAALVATDALGLQWFECNGHADGQPNLGDFVPVRREPIDEWFRRIPEPS